MELLLKQLPACTDEVDVMRRLMECAMRIMQAQASTAQLVEQGYLRLRLVGQCGFSPDFEDHFRYVDRYSGSVCSRAMLERAPVVVEDTRLDEACRPHREVYEQASVRAIVSVPVISGHGAFCGMVSTLKPVPGLPSALQMQMLQEAASSSAQAIFGLRSGRLGRVQQAEGN